MILTNGHLNAGVRQFRETGFAPHKDLFAELAGGQSPPTLFITCADSRIDPALITQTDPGSLFVCRNAGNIVPAWTDRADGMIASVEYAVAVLGVSHAVVCGHSACGAMGALADPPPADAVPAVHRWLPEAGITLNEGESVDELIARNTLVQLANLRTHPSVAAAEASGKLELHAWVYDIGSGRIDAISEDGTRSEVGGEMPQA